MMNQERHSFPTTQWTAVVKEALSEDAERRLKAWSGLARDYWMPLYAFSRRLGHDKSDAEDLTQGFFGYLLEHRKLDAVNRELGTLRTFLLKVFQRYIRDWQGRANAQKRGGGAHIFSLDLNDGEDLIGANLASTETPELLYDRTWAHSLLRASLRHLADEEEAAGRGRLFAALEPCLNPDAETEASHARAATELGMTVESVRQALSRLRKRFRDCLRERIAATLQEPDDTRIDEELHALKSALRQ